MKEYRSRNWRARFDKQIRPFPENGTVHQKSAHEVGGVLVVTTLKSPQGKNGGCGTPTNVVGTNGGTMLCGSVLHAFGKSEPYFCGHCSD